MPPLASSANKGTIGRSTVRLPIRRAASEEYYALATYDANLGKYGEKQHTVRTIPVDVPYFDQELRHVVAFWQADSNTMTASPVLLSPETRSMPRSDLIFIQNMSPKFRHFTLDGEQVATAARDSGR